MSSHFGFGRTSTLEAGPVAVSTMDNNLVISYFVPPTPHFCYVPSSHPVIPFMSIPSMFSFGPGGAGSSLPLSTMQSFSGGSPGSFSINGPTSKMNMNVSTKKCML